MQMDGQDGVAAFACKHSGPVLWGSRGARCAGGRAPHMAARARQAGEDRAVLVEDASSGEDGDSSGDGERDEPAAGCAPGQPVRTLPRRARWGQQAQRACRAASPQLGQA